MICAEQNRHRHLGEPRKCFCKVVFLLPINRDLTGQTDIFLLSTILLSHTYLPGLLSPGDMIDLMRSKFMVFIVYV
jgi:hypothetical protein